MIGLPEPAAGMALPDVNAKGIPMEFFHEPGRGYYWATNNQGKWIPVTDRNMSLRLKAEGFSNRPGDACLTPLEAKLLEIQNEHSVSFAGPLAGYSKGLIEVNGHRILVTSSPKLITPVAGEWPILHQVLFNMLGDDGSRQFDTFCGWMKCSLESLTERTFRASQVLAFAGPTDCGKSLMQLIITECLGGRAAKAHLFMSGASTFNAELFGCEHMMLEDEIPGTDYKSRRRFGAALKEFTVTELRSCHGKGKEAIGLKPYCRVTMSLNNERENLMILPIMDDSVRDKITLLRVERAPMPMPTHTNVEKTAFWDVIVSELPAFLSFLQGWEIPAEMRCERFGVKAFQHPELMEALDELSPESHLLCLIDAALFPAQYEGEFPRIKYHDTQVTAEELHSMLRSVDALKFQTDRLLGHSSNCANYLGRLAKIRPDRVTKAPRKNKRRGGWILRPPEEEESIPPVS